jgi:protein-histidine N-methyltransferase
MFSFHFYDETGQDKTEEVEEDGGYIRSIPLEDILEQLPDTLAFSIVAGIPRRELWHIKMQLMQNDQDLHLLGDSDIIKGSYEGGLKTWECSIDLVNYLSQQTFPSQLSVLEVPRFVD